MDIVKYYKSLARKYKKFNKKHDVYFFYLLLNKAKK